MTIHEYHPDVHEFGLQDGCARCEELAQTLGGLDREMRERICAGKLFTRLDRVAYENFKSIGVAE